MGWPRAPRTRRAMRPTASAARTAWSTSAHKPRSRLYPPRPRDRMSGRGNCMWSLTILMGLFLGVAEAAPPPALPADARLEPVRGRLETLLAHTAEAGLPADML